MKITILDDYFDTLRHLPCFTKLAGHEVKICNDHLQDEAALAARLATTEVLVLFRERTTIGAGLLDRLPKLRLISQRSAYPHVDLAACTRNQVLLCSNMHSDTPSWAAAELTFGLMLAAARQIPQQMASLCAGNWQMGVGHTLRGKTLGIWSYGRIGSAVAAYAKAFGMDVQVWGGEESTGRAVAAGFRRATNRQSFFATSDIVSLHLRLHPSTTGIITLADLQRLPPDSLVVNTSRARIIAPGALVKALQSGTPAMAAVDVFDQEPLHDSSDPLLSMPNVICTPHIGYVTNEEYDLQFSDIFDQIVAYAQGQPVNMINPEVWHAQSS